MALRSPFAAASLYHCAALLSSRPTPSLGVDLAEQRHRRRIVFLRALGGFGERGEIVAALEGAVGDIDVAGSVCRRWRRGAVASAFARTARQRARESERGEPSTRRRDCAARRSCRGLRQAQGLRCGGDLRSGALRRRARSNRRARRNRRLPRPAPQLRQAKRHKPTQGSSNTSAHQATRSSTTREGGALAGGIRLAEHDVVGAGLGGHHGVVAAGKAADAGDALGLESGRARR